MSDFASQLEQAARACDLRALTHLAGIRDEHDRGDRLALMQICIGRAPDDLVDRICDLADVLALRPELTCPTEGLVDRLRACAAEAFGPVAAEELRIDEVVCGFLKRLAHESSDQAEAAAIPNEAQWLAILDWLAILALPGQGLEIHRAQCGSRIACGALTGCRECDGSGKLPCPECHGEGRLDDEAIARGYQLAPSGVRLQIDGLLRGPGLSRAEARRLLGAGIGGCDTCEGEGDTKCRCVVFADLPRNARAGWIVEMQSAAGDHVGWLRVEAVEG